MYFDLANAGDDCVHFPISSDGCGAQECSKGTQHHVTCNWNSVPATVSGTAAPYTMKANGLVQASSSGCVTANISVSPSTAQPREGIGLKWQWGCTRERLGTTPHLSKK